MITITISGSRNCGKSTLAKVIAEALIEKGLDVVVEDPLIDGADYTTLDDRDVKFAMGVLAYNSSYVAPLKVRTVCASPQDADVLEAYAVR